MLKALSIPVPVLGDTDILVIGSTCAAVAAALEARQSGRSVMLVGDLSYLGSDLAGTFRLWANGWRLEDPLLKAAFAEGPDFPARPATIKRAMEEALIAASVPFLFASRPVSFLRSDSGDLAGAIIASRTSLMAIRCRTVIDATEHGIGARLAGLPLQSRNGKPSAVAWTILAKDAPAAWPGKVEELHPPFCQKLDAGVETYAAFRLSIDRDQLGSDPIAAEHVARSLLVDDNLFMTADLLMEPPTHVVSSTSGLKEQLVKLDEGDLQPSPGLWMLGGLLPLSETGLLEIGDPERAISLGRFIGKAAADGVKPKAGATGCFLQPHGDQSGNFGFANALMRGEQPVLELSGWLFPSLGKFDVVVAGGGTGGVPAGIASARSGANTLVVEAQHGLGGVGTIGLISSYFFGNKVGFTSELDQWVQRTDSYSRAQNGVRWTPEIKSHAYHQMLQSVGGRAWTGSFTFGVKTDRQKVVGVLISTPYGCGLVEAEAVVDASGNADIAAAAGAPCRVIDAHHVAVQGAGLSPRNHPAVKGQNSDHMFIDETDPVGITAAYVNARAKFQRAFDTAPFIDSRERRQIVGDLELSPLDLLARRTFPDTVYTAFSNFDTHGFTVHPLFMLTPPDHEPFYTDVPFRCMLPRGVEGVLVTGLGMSAHRDALPVIRMQPDIQNQGYGAGLAAAQSALEKKSFRQLDIRELQRKLVDLQILAPEILEQQDSFPMSPEAICQAVQGDLGQLMNIAILLAHPDESRRPLMEVMEHDGDVNRRNSAALILGMMEEAAAGPILNQIVDSAPWDEGWNYRGMGQFGSSMSRLDVTIIALSKTRAPEAVATLERKIMALGETAQFSHCRAVSLAAAAMPHRRLAEALSALLEKPTLSGHAIQDLEELKAHANENIIETEPRNLALREIYLGMGLYLAGDVRGIGKKILESYANDLRGPFARYAHALLATHDHEALRTRLA